MKPLSVFPASVRQSCRLMNRNGQPHTERECEAILPCAALEDAEAFHEIAEGIRLSMIEELRTHGAPINVWRSGMLTVRTRTSHESPDIQPYDTTLKD